MNFRKFAMGLIALLMTVIGLTAHPARADTSAREVTVILNKRIWIDQLPTQKTNIGTEQADFGGQPLAGATFEVYDATDLYQQALAQSDFDAKTWMKSWTTKSLTQIHAAGLTKAVATATTDANGQATIQLSESELAAYLFVETNIVNTTYTITDKTESVPLMLLLPYYDSQTNQELSTIHIYLKNAGTRVTPTKPSETPETPNTKQPTTETSIWHKLPNTGQAKSAITAVGLCILAFGGWLIWHKKQGKNETDNQGGNQK